MRYFLFPSWWNYLILRGTLKCNKCVISHLPTIIDHRTLQFSSPSSLESTCFYIIYLLASISSRLFSFPQISLRKYTWWSEHIVVRSLKIDPDGIIFFTFRFIPFHFFLPFLTSVLYDISFFSLSIVFSVCLAFNRNLFFCIAVI